MDKKYIFIGSLIIGVVVIIVMAFFAFRSPDKPQQQNSNQTSMDELLSNKAISSHDGILVLVDDPEYFLSFNTAHQEFQIQLLPPEQTNLVINQIRQKAESKLLEVSQLDGNEICKFNVVESVHFSYWPEMSGINYGFSKCPNAVIIND